MIGAAQRSQGRLEAITGALLVNAEIVGLWMVHGSSVPLGHAMGSPISSLPVRCTWFCYLGLALAA